MTTAPHAGLPAPQADLLALVQQAGEATLAYFDDQAALGVRLKSDASPVTDADEAAHQIISDGLAKLSPTCPVVSEEGALPTAAERAVWHQWWLVDPVDGTKEFIKGNREYSVNLALIEAGRPVWGAVYAPALSEWYWGGPVSGAWQATSLADQPQALAAAGPPSVDQAWRVFTSRSHSRPANQACLACFPSVETVPLGSSLKLCRIAAGDGHAYPRLGPTMHWDTAAAHAVLSGAGGLLVDTNGSELDYGPGADAGLRNPWFIALGCAWSALPQAVRAFLARCHQMSSADSDTSS